MKRILWLAILPATSLFAQRPANTNLQTMIQVEQAFAKLARTTNTRKAFLAYLSGDAVVFGQGPVNGKEKWEGRPVDDSKLDWEPEYADISAGGDLGYTSGPWEWRAHRTDKNPGAHGHFISVWKKQPNGVFENILDIGVPHPHDPESHPMRTSTIHAPKRSDKAGTTISIMDVENEFLAALLSGGGKAHGRALSREARLFRTGKLPMTIPANTVPCAEREGSTINYKPMQSGVALSGDLGYVYGTASWQEAGKAELNHANYTRIWKNEDGTHWKIALEVVSNW